MKNVRDSYRLRGDTLLKVSFESKGDFSGSLEWLESLTSRDPTSTVNKMGEEGVKALASNTPKDTGATAAGWGYKVETKNHVTELSWVNNAHPNLNVNLATLIELGHGTRNGGYVSPRPYIQKSMDPIFNNAGDRLLKELTE